MQKKLEKRIINGKVIRHAQLAPVQSILLRLLN